MRVHHLIGGVMHPPFMPRVICHLLLCEHNSGLVLVDSGFSTADLADTRRLGPSRFMVRPDSDKTFTAHAAVTAAGFAPDDVTDIVLTHLDFDHVGGVADFPRARLHTTAEEWSAATVDTKLRERARYRRTQWAGHTDIAVYEGRGDRWRDDLIGHQVLDGIVLIPMPGHTRGHAAVAVEADNELIVHAGDAVFDASDYGVDVAANKLIRFYEQALAADRRAIAGNHAALAALHAQPGTTVINAHDERMFPGS